MQQEIKYFAHQIQRIILKLVILNLFYPIRLFLRGKKYNKPYLQNIFVKLVKLSICSFRISWWIRWKKLEIFIYICVFCTDMNDVAIFVNHNIAVMTIFDLQQETKDTVGRHWGYEIAPCRFETLTTFITKFLHKIEKKNIRFSCFFLSEFCPHSQRIRWSSANSSQNSLRIRCISVFLVKILLAFLKEFGAHLIFWSEFCPHS